jgi:large subunit ribosomal protein L15
MPLQRRLPKRGFASTTASQNAEVRLYQLGAVEGEVIDLATLREAGIINSRILNVKIIATGEIGRAVTVRGVKVTKGAREAIEAAGGKVE